VLNVSKLSAGLMTLNPADFAPCNEVMNTVRMFRDQVAARGVQLHFERDESVDALQVERVWGDSGRFIQVIVNFTEPAPRRVIRVRFGTTCAPEESAEADEDAWPEMDLEDLLPMCRERPVLGATSESLRLYIAIADSGLGMTDEEQVRLFQRFVQASPRTYGEFGGSGLGLVSDVRRFLGQTMTTRAVCVPNARRTSGRQNPSPEQAERGDSSSIFRHRQAVGRRASSCASR
jgi:signal transduction histidine kinase